MERRSEPRVQANAPVIITVLVGQRQEPMGGMIQEVSGSGMRVRLPQAIARNTPVRIETSDMLLLGEVVRCEPADNEFHLGLMLRHSLQDLHDLERLSRVLMGEREQQSDEEEPIPASNHIMRE